MTHSVKVDPRTLRPLDEETIVRSAIKTGRVLIVHEACKIGGYGGALAAVIAGSEAFDYLDAPIIRLAGRDIPILYNRRLEYRTVPQVENILYNLSAEDRAVMSQAMPLAVTQQLVPVVWKEKWELMSPFLLG